MPKHIKISKHPETRKFYVSDVCEFLSVEVCLSVYCGSSLTVQISVGIGSILSAELVRFQFSWCGHHPQPPLS